MAKLMPSVSLAICVIAALTVIAHCGSDWLCIGGSCKETIQEIRKKPLAERTRDEWIKLGKPCSKELANANIKLKVISDDDCSYRSNLKEKLEEFLAKTKISNPECFNLVSEYFSVYLDTCGIERDFRRAIETIKQNSDKKLALDEHSSFNSYLEAEYWPTENRPELKYLLATMGLFHDVSGNEYLDEKHYYDCLRTNLQKFQMLPKWHELVSKYFEFYFDRCGYEASFKKMIGSLENNSDVALDSSKFTTLYSYLGEETIKTLHFDQLISFLSSVVDKIAPLANSPGETACTETPIARSVELLLDSEHSWAHEFKEVYLALYFKKCGFEQSFNMIQRMKKNSNEDSTDSGEYPTLRSVLGAIVSEGKQSEKVRIDDELEKALTSMLSVIKELAASVSVQDEADCTRKLQNDLRAWMEVASGSESQMNNLARDYFTLYLGTCGFEKSFKKAIHNIKQTSHEHWNSDECPTLDTCLELDIWPRIDEYSARHEVSMMFSFINELPALEHISMETNCNEDLESELLRLLFVFEAYPHLYELVFDHFSLYLDTCGLERQFTTAIANVEQMSHEPWNKVTSSTLYKYFRTKCSAGSSIHEMDPTRLLSLIRELSAFGSISEKPDCTDEIKVTLVEWLDDSKIYPELFNPIKNYFELYLDTCGFEKRFKEGMNQREIPLDEGDSPLATYIFDKSAIKESLHGGFAKQVPPMLNVVSQMPGLGQFDASNCNKEKSDNIIELKDRLIGEADSKLVVYLYGVSRDYFEVCANHFKAMAENFAHSNKEAWDFIVKSADAIKFAIADLIYNSDSTQMPSASIEELISRAAASMDHKAWNEDMLHDEKSEKLSRELQDSCEALWEVMYPTMYTLAKSDIRFLEGEDIRSYMKGLSLCSRLITGIDEIKTWFINVEDPFYAD